MDSLNQTAYPRDARRLLTGIVVPDTPIVARATEYARSAQRVWGGVALNWTPSIALCKEGKVALCTLGIGLDWGGWGYETLTPTLLNAPFKE
jgi:hypothetical protein